jgi:hypothetical protein
MKEVFALAQESKMPLLLVDVSDTDLLPRNAQDDEAAFFRHLRIDTWATYNAPDFLKSYRGRNALTEPPNLPWHVLVDRRGTILYEGKTITAEDIQRVLGDRQQDRAPKVLQVAGPAEGEKLPSRALENQRPPSITPLTESQRTHHGRSERHVAKSSR